MIIFASVTTYLLLGGLVAADLHREMHADRLHERPDYPTVGWPLFLILVVLLWPLQVAARAVGALGFLIGRTLDRRKGGDR